MNSTPDPPRQDDPETRITALLLGELTPAEAEEVRAAIARDPELARLRDRLQETIGLLRTALAQPEAARTAETPLARMSEERRESLLRTIRAVPFPASESQPGARVPGDRWYIPMSIAALLVALLGVATVWSPMGSPVKSRRLARLSDESALARDVAPSTSAEARSGMDEGTVRFRARGLVTDRPVPTAPPPPAPAGGQSGTAPHMVESAGLERPGSGGFGGGAGGVPTSGPAPALKEGEQLERSKVLPVIEEQFGAIATTAAPAERGAVVAGAEIVLQDRLAPATPGASEHLMKQTPQTDSAAPPPPSPARTPGEPAQTFNRRLSPTERYGLDVKSEPANEAKRPAPDTAYITEFAVPGKPLDVLAQDGSTPAPQQQIEELALKRRALADFDARDGLSDRAGGIVTPPSAGTAAGQASADRLGRNYFFSEALPTTPSLGDQPELGVALRGEVEVTEAKRKSVGDLEAKLAERPEPGMEAAGRGGSIRSRPEAEQLPGPSKDQRQWEFLWEGRGQDPSRAANETAGEKSAFAKSLASLGSSVRDERLIVPRLETPAPVAAATEVDAETPPALPAPPPAEPQPEVETADNPFSTFSLNVTDVSFKLAAAALEKGILPDRGAIRSEEFVNAFDYRDPMPAPGRPVAFHWERAHYPFAHNRDLLRFSVKTAARGREAGRPLNVVLCLDNSGSMERADRVATIHEALRVLAAQLTPQDRISVVTFSRNARLWVDGLRGDLAGGLAGQVADLTPQGGTNLEDALRLAYETARRHYLAEGMNRVVLLTDGAANLGEIDPATLKQQVESQRTQGIALDCFGIGWEGFNDDLLEVLSRNGDGRYGFVNTPVEAATEFASQLAGALQVAASDVKVQVEFNPRRVNAYRQVGYQKHQLTREQFRDNTVDAAEIGAAEAGNALYVVSVNPAGEGPLGIARVRYKVPGTTRYEEHEWSLDYTGPALALSDASPSLRLAGAAGAFAEWLAASPLAAGITPDALLELLRGVPDHYGADPRPTRIEWMIRQAKSVSGQ